MEGERKEFKPQEEKEQIFLEIGVGRYPLVRWQSFLEHLKENPKIHYIGIDIEESFLKLDKLEIEGGFISLPELKKRIFLSVASGENLPLKDESVQEVFLGNVLGDPQFGYKLERKLLGIPFSEVERIKIKMLWEIWRVLKPAGRLIILENATPEVADEFLENHREEIEEKFFQITDPKILEEYLKIFPKVIVWLIKNRCATLRVFEKKKEGN